MIRHFDFPFKTQQDIDVEGIIAAVERAMRDGAVTRARALAAWGAEERRRELERVRGERDE